MRAFVLPMVALLVGMAPPVGAVQVDAAPREKLLRLGPMPPVPLDPTNRWSGNDAAADLGQRLFYDANLSRELRHLPRGAERVRRFAATGARHR